MSELTDEEKALLAQAEEKPRRGRARKDAPVAATPAPVAPARGPHSPAQFDDDGWGDTPVQMRG